LRVLAIDGGGIRGIIPGVMLVEIERITGRPIRESFDLMVGTSTEGILALGLAVPDDGGHPRYSAEELLRLYTEQGGAIFSSRGLFGVAQRVGLSWEGTLGTPATLATSRAVSRRS
jgi:uncharacterized protein